MEHIFLSLSVAVGQALRRIRDRKKRKYDQSISTEPGWYFSVVYWHASRHPFYHCIPGWVQVHTYQKQWGNHFFFTGSICCPITSFYCSLFSWTILYLIWTYEFYLLYIYLFDAQKNVLKLCWKCCLEFLLLKLAYKWRNQWCITLKYLLKYIANCNL